MMSKEVKKRLNEAAEKVASTARDAAVALGRAASAFVAFACSAAEAAKIIKDEKFLAQFTLPTDEMLKSVATGKEWHLMRHAKKRRVRKKYRNRLTKRYYKERQTERRSKA